MIDLHTHSTFSDGSFSPEDLVRTCAEAGLTGVALTDHDTVEGVPRFMAACEAHGITGVPGVEISADVEKGGMHMLGYFVEPASESLEATLVKIRSGREDRNIEILENLNKAGLELTMDEVISFAGEGVVGRPHFAQAMLARGYIKTKDEAFKKYLARGKSGYADRFRLTPEQSIDLIHDAGGLAVLAHPFTLELSDSELGRFVKELAGVGLDGMEVYYSEHNHSQVNAYRNIAYENGILLAGGSDFHGEINPAIKLGVGFGNLRVNDDLLEKLAEKAKERC